MLNPVIVYFLFCGVLTHFLAKLHARSKDVVLADLFLLYVVMCIPVINIAVLFSVWLDESNIGYVIKHKIIYRKEK